MQHFQQRELKTDFAWRVLNAKRLSMQLAEVDRTTLEGSPNRNTKSGRGRALAPIPTSRQGELRKAPEPDEHALQSWGPARNLRHESNLPRAARCKTEEDPHCLDSR